MKLRIISLFILYISNREIIEDFGSTEVDNNTQ